eukprot:gene34067-biopygen9659
MTMATKQAAKAACLVPTFPSRTGQWEPTLQAETRIDRLRGPPEPLDHGVFLRDLTVSQQDGLEIEVQRHLDARACVKATNAKRTWEPHTVDRFASEVSSQLPRDYAQWRYPGCNGAHILIYDSRGEVNWINLPWGLLDELTHKLREEGVGGTVVAHPGRANPGSGIWRYSGTRSSLYLLAVNNHHEDTGCEGAAKGRTVHPGEHMAALQMETEAAPGETKMERTGLPAKHMCTEAALMLLPDGDEDLRRGAGTQGAEEEAVHPLVRGGAAATAPEALDTVQGEATQRVTPEWTPTVGVPCSNWRLPGERASSTGLDTDLAKEWRQLALSSVGIWVAGAAGPEFFGCWSLPRQHPVPEWVTLRKEGQSGSRAAG